nr:hypothetical protein [uncultured Gellertiella sp.]
MSMFLDPSTIVWNRFQGLEPREDKWIGDIDFWESFNTVFFASNGMEYVRARDSNVEAWVTAEDRAPFSNMVEALLPRLAENNDLARIDMVILAHWLPDLHLGSSVTNFAMHALGLDNARGFAISDRGLTAPFYALDLLSRCMNNSKVKKALLLVMDQKHLLYRSALVDQVKPENSGLAMVLSSETKGGHVFAGYARKTLSRNDNLAGHLSAMAHEMGIDLRRARVIAHDEVLAYLDDGISRTVIDPALMCAAPFCALQTAAGFGGPFVLACRQDDILTIVGFKPVGGDHAA